MAEQSFMVFDVIWKGEPSEDPDRFNVIVPADVMAKADAAGEEKWESIVARYISEEIQRRFKARPEDFRFA